MMMCTHAGVVSKDECPYCKAPEIQHNPNQWEACQLKQRISKLESKIEQVRSHCEYRQANSYSCRAVLKILGKREK
jgi:hypothetical protein